MNCTKHNTLEAIGFCSYCGKPFCSSCLVISGSSSLCNDHCLTTNPNKEGDNRRVLVQEIHDSPKTEINNTISSKNQEPKRLDKTTNKIITKFIRIFVFTIIVFTFIQVKNAMDTQTVNSQIDAIVNEDGKIKSAMLDAYTRFDDVFRSGKTITYYFTIPYSKHDLALAVNLPQLFLSQKNEVISRLRTTMQSRVILYKNSDITLCYKYVDALGIPLGEFIIDPNDIDTSVIPQVDHWTVNSQGAISLSDVLFSVSNNVRYYEVDPNLASRWQYPVETQITRSGDCKDFSSLAVQMLHQNGIQAKFIIARVRMGKDSNVSGHAFIKIGNMYYEPQSPNGKITYEIVKIDQELDYNAMVELINRKHK